jgi:iron complex outermembrane receptor protein
MKSNLSIRLSAVLPCLCMPLYVLAESVPDEIIVTADFRNRPVGELASSITIMNAEFIEEAAVQHFEELVNIVPNLSWSGDGHRARYFQIRGVGELEQYQGAPNPSVGFLIDDIDFSGIGTVATLFDVQSVEVLRGSQGSRYGANALGGLIYVQSAAPSTARNGRLAVTVGDDDALSIGAAMSGALNDSETTTFRISAQKYESNGFRDNPYLMRKDTNKRDELALKTRFRFAPSGSFEANVALMYSKIDNGYDAFSLDNTYTMLSDKPGKDAQESIGTSLRLDWTDLGELTLTSITSLANSDIDFSYDADWGNDDSWAPVTYDYVSDSDRERDSVSQEFRLSSNRWLVGLYASNIQEELQTLNTGDYYDPFYDFADSLFYPFDSDYEATSVSLFGQYDYDFSEVTRMTAAIRFEQRDSDYSDTDGLTASQSDSMWGGELSISRDMNDAITAFARISKGYKSGGFNLGVVDPDIREFAAEELWTIEAGIKSVLLNNDLHLNASIFQSRRVDQQVRTSFQLQAGDPTSFGFATINVDEGETFGVEADIRWYPSDHWELYANIGLLDATLGKFPALRPGPSGREQAHAPRYTLAGGVVFRHPIGVFARLDATSKDAFYYDVSHDQRSKSYALVNTRVGYGGESWAVSLWAKNLLDENYAVRGFYFGNEPPDFPDTLYTRLGDPRQIGITVEKRF